jgi:hypothetical protein
MIKSKNNAKAIWLCLQKYNSCKGEEEKGEGKTTISIEISAWPTN